MVAAYDDLRAESIVDSQQGSGMHIRRGTARQRQYLWMKQLGQAAVRSGRRPARAASGSGGAAGAESAVDDRDCVDLDEVVRLG